MTFTKVSDTYQIKIYSSGDISVGKNVVRKYCLNVGLCVTIESTTFVYTGGEEQGFVVGLLNYPRFPSTQEELLDKATKLAYDLLEGCYQHSILIVTPKESIWVTKREVGHANF